MPREKSGKSAAGQTAAAPACRVAGFGVCSLCGGIAEGLAVVTLSAFVWEGSRQPQREDDGERADTLQPRRGRWVPRASAVEGQ